MADRPIRRVANPDLIDVSISDTAAIDVQRICKALGKLSVYIPETSFSLVSNIAADTRAEAYTKYFNRHYSPTAHTLGLLTANNPTRPRGYWYIYKKDMDGHKRGDKEWRPWKGTWGGKPFSWQASWYQPKHTRQTRAGLVDHHGRKLVGFSLKKIDKNTKVAYFASYPMNLYEDDVSFIAFGKGEVKRKGLHLFANKQYLYADIIANNNEKNQQKYIDKVMQKAKEGGLQIE